jgi:hypothetical protein
MLFLFIRDSFTEVLVRNFSVSADIFFSTDKENPASE